MALTPEAFLLFGKMPPDGSCKKRDVIGGLVGGALGPAWRRQEGPHLDGDSWVGLPRVLSQSAAIHSCRGQKVNQCPSSSRTFFSYMREYLNLYKGILTKYCETCISFLESTVR